MTGKNFKIEIFTSMEDISQRWIDLEQEGHASPFQSYSWCAALYTHIGRPRDVSLCIVMVMDEVGSKDVMLLPLMVSPDKAGRRMISFFDLGVSDYSAPVLAPLGSPDSTDFHELWPRILEKLPPADYLQINKMPEKIGSLPNPLPNALGAVLADLKFYDLQLPQDWADYYPLVLSRRTRKNLRQRWRRLKAVGETGFVHGNTPQKAQEMFEILLRQRRERFAELGREEILNRSDYVGFYRSLVTDTKPEHPSVINALSVDGKVIAVLFGLLYKDKYCMLLSSFEGGGWAQYSPGLLIVETMMQWLHGRGIRQYDFTIGSESYKQKLGGQERDLYEHTLPFSLSGRCVTGATSAKRTIKTLLGKI